MKRQYLACLLAPVLALAGCAAGDSSTSEEGPVAAEEAAATAVAGHPRLWIRQADVPRLQSWATSSNPMFAQGLKPAVDAAISTYDTKFYPGGQPNPAWPDDGSDNWVQYPTEAYAQIFAFMSLVDPDPNARAQHATRARNLLMHAMNEAVKGVDTSASPAPFRGKMFSTFNRANYWGEAWGLIVDWIYPSLTAGDKATIQKVFLRWSNECVNASTTSAEHPQPIGVLNDPQLLADKKQLRWAANNYYTGHMRALTLMSLAMDAADDPLVNASQPVNQLGNSMRSYLADVLGAWLYQQYAMYEDPAISSAKLGVPASGLGLASGGLSVEGSLYGHALGYLQQAMLALYTAGYADPTLAGPQSGLITSAYWDRFMDGFLHNVTPAGQVSSDPNYSYIGPIYQPAGYGDMLRFWMTSEFISSVGSLGALDQITGNTPRLQRSRWFAQNVLEGGSAKLYQRASAVWGDACATCSINYFLLFDPSAAAPADPRPSMPTTFVDKPLGRVLARTDWSPQASWFTYLCGWETINHQNGACNQFELYRKGEWLTKELTGYGNDQILMTGDYNNTLGIQNDVPQGINWFEQQTSARGGQWTNGSNAGDPTVVSSAGGAWVYAAADSTNLYNRLGWDAAHSAMDVTHASRAIVWLKPDHVVVYDRATTKTANRFKKFNLSLTGNPKVSGKTADVVTPGGQHLFVQSILPAGATLTGSAAETIDRVSDLEPAKYRLVIQDPSNPSDVRFLNVLQGADAGASADAVTLVQSTSGSALQGVVVKNMAVLFPVSATTPFTGSTYTLPGSVTTHLVAGLAPSTGYTVTTQSTSGGVQVTLSVGGSTTTDAAGVLAIAGGSSTPPPPTTTCTPAIGVATASVAAAGSTGTVSVNVASGCAWTATSNASWITVTSGSSGTGAGSVGYSVAANTTTSARTGTITVAGQTFTVSQSAASSAPTPTCTPSIGSTSASAAAAGSTGTVSVNVASGCAWTAASNASWITVTSGSSGTGAGTVGYSVAANTATSARTGTITIAGKTFTVSQSAASSTPPTTTCSFTLSSTSASVSKAGVTQSFSFTAPAGCAWLAASNASWIWVMQPSSGTGAGTITYKVLANYGGARTGAISVGGKTFTITQATGP